MLEGGRRLDGFRALHVARRHALLARGRDLFRYDFRGRPTPFATLPLGPRWQDVAAKGHRLLRRGLRYGFRCAARIDDGYLVSSSTAIFHVGDDGSWRVDREITRNHRPLVIDSLDGVDGWDRSACYGDYGGNPDRVPMRVWNRSQSGTWRGIYEFPAGAIDHVHAVVPDPHRQCIWVLTGDYGGAAAIWVTHDGFESLVPVGRGQQFRACNAFALPEGLLYATDSHLERNSIRLLKPTAAGWSSEFVANMIGSCLAACRIGERFYFSTAVEPGEPTGLYAYDLVELKRGPGILANACTVVGGNLSDGFKPLLSMASDAWPKRLLGFSVLQLPRTEPDAAHLVVTGAGVRGLDDATMVYEIGPSGGVP